MLKGAGRHQLVNGRFGVRPSIAPPSVNGSRGVSLGRSQAQETANASFGFGQSGVPQGTQLRSFAKPTAVGLNIGLISNEPHQVITLAREMYDNDAICGPVADTLSDIPFGNFSLSGIPVDAMKPYLSSIDRVRAKTLMPVLTRSHLVNGAFLANGLFDQHDKVWDAICPQDLLSANIVPAPFFGSTPIVDIQIHQDTLRALKATDERMQRYLKFMPRDMLQGGVIKLQPENTFYIPNRSLAHVPLGVSMFRKAMIVYILEKALARGTIEMAYRRQRPIIHIVAGDENWDPSQAEMQELSQLFMASDLDPLGAVIVTRQGVSPQEMGGCLTGDTIVSTTKGLRRLDSLVDHDIKTLVPGTSVDVDWSIKNDTGNFAPVYKWWYHGIKRVRKISTRTHSITCTKQHRFQTLNIDGSVGLAESNMLSVGSYLLADTNGVDHDYCPDIVAYESEIENRPTNIGFKKPTHMTEKLAWCIGQLISDGSLEPSIVLARCTLQAPMKVFAQYMEELFGMPVTVRRELRETPKERRRMNKESEYHYTAYVNSKKHVEYFQNIGLVNSKSQNGAASSNFRVIPDCIMQANHKCKIAFLAAYVDADGCISRNTRGGNFSVRIASFSPEILESIRHILHDMGYTAIIGECALALGTNDSHALCKELRGASRKAEQVHEHSRDMNGVPGNIICNFIKDRFIRRHSNHGSIYRHDNGDLVFVRDSRTLFRHYSAGREHYPSWVYSAYDRGHYDEHMKIIHRVSPILWSRLKFLFAKKYRIERIESIRDMGMKPVYDLSMDRTYGKSLYVANGLITKNSGDLWKWTDNMDVITALKLKALGMPDGLLGGDMALDSVSATLTIFINKTRQLRDYITRMFFYEKFFPYISITNGHRKEHFPDFQETGRRVQDVSSRFQTRASDTDVDMNDYITPTIAWHQSLRPEGDKEYLELLQTATQMGVPVPIRVLTAACGLEAQDLLNSAPDDIAQRTKLAQYRAQIAGIEQAVGGGQDEGQGGYEGAGFDPHTMISPIKRISLAERATRGQFERMGIRSPSNNHKHYTTTREQRWKGERANRVIAHAQADVARKLNRLVRLEKHHKGEVTVF